MLVLAAGCASASSQMYLVTAAVEHLRAAPGTTPQPGTHDPDQETQLLYGEHVRLISTQDAWAYVEAMEQPEFTHANRWQGYPGWLPLSSLQPQHRKRSVNAVITTKWATIWSDEPQRQRAFDLPMGTWLYVEPSDGDTVPVWLANGAQGWLARREIEWLKSLRGLPPQTRRRRIVQAASQLLDDPYVWGGRSPFKSEAESVTGVDCSGLVNLSYRTVGITIPRDAHEQFLRAERVAQLQPADLIFLSDENQPRKITHVMLYAGEGWLIEGPGTGLTVRRMTVAQRFGRPLDRLQPGTLVGHRTVYFGTYLP
ncbi:MAG: C40 family peptidase [Candidatus Omnitrophica bacterium]|nr:C40 family peptidase [Candidatus Omnitrophota bacterium]